MPEMFIAMDMDIKWCRRNFPRKKTRHISIWIPKTLTSNLWSYRENKTNRIEFNRLRERYRNRPFILRDWSGAIFLRLFSFDRTIIMLFLFNFKAKTILFCPHLAPKEKKNGCGNKISRISIEICRAAVWLTNVARKLYGVHGNEDNFI